MGVAVMPALCIAMAIVAGAPRTRGAAARGPTSRPTARVTRADLDRAAAAMRKELGAAFRIEAEAPFVVAGDLPRAGFQRITVGTIRGCSRALGRQFFTKRPTYVIRVYLFDGQESYQTHVQRLFGHEPDTPFGFYSSDRRSLVMNIATGTGTLVHEMVHALAEPDWPDIPAWFNEGLGSLFEQCRFDGPDRLVGLPNWRLPGLQRAIRQDRLVDLVRLMALTDDEFYGTASGLHYAEARYFCMYLQTRHVLARFYHLYRHGFGKDRTGVRFVRELTGPSMSVLQGRWVRWVQGLRYEKRRRE